MLPSTLKSINCEDSSKLVSPSISPPTWAAAAMANPCFCFFVVVVGGGVVVWLLKLLLLLLMLLLLLLLFLFS